MSTLTQIRQQLRAQFPAAHEPRTPPPSFSPQGLPAFPRGALTELTAPGLSCGLSLLFSRLLDSPPEDTGHRPLALIDRGDAFDPDSHSASACARLLWLRCETVEQALRCADLLLRDGNLPILALDLRLTPQSELRTIAPTSWYRLRNLAEQSGSALLTFTPHHLVPCAALHLTLDSTFHLAQLETDRSLLQENIHYKKPLSRISHET